MMYGHWSQGGVGERDYKRVKGNESDGYVHYPDYGDGSTAYIHQNLLNIRNIHIFEIYA